MEKGLLYDTRVARGLKQMLDIIDAVFEICKKPASAKKPKFTTKHNIENGFYIKNNQTYSQLFFGIWYSSWEQFEIPISISVNYYGNAPVSKHSQIKAWVEKKEIDGIMFKEFQDHAMLVFQESFFNFDDDAERMYKILNDLNAYLDVEYKRENP